MLRRIDKSNHHSSARGDSLRRGEELHQELGLAPNAGNVIPFPRRPPLLPYGTESVGDLAVLEAENAALRNSVIELVLKIQELRGDPFERLRASRPF